MSDQNKCRDLHIPDSWKNNEDSLSKIFELQKRIQTENYGFNFKEMRLRIGNMVEYFYLNQHALQDELHEFLDALGGVDSAGSSAWKSWRSNHKAVQEKRFSDLTDDELKELKFELVDIFHFVVNLALMIDMSPQEMCNMYFAKNHENIRRTKENY